MVSSDGEANRASTLTVNYRYVASGITLSQSSANLSVGETLQLSATVKPAGISTTITWSSSNSSVAHVSGLGFVTVLSSGSAVITAKTSNGKTASCTITVKEKITRQETGKTCSFLIPIDGGAPIPLAYYVDFNCSTTIKPKFKSCLRN